MTIDAKINEIEPRESFPRGGYVIDFGQGCVYEHGSIAPLFKNDKHDSTDLTKVLTKIIERNYHGEAIGEGVKQALDFLQTKEKSSRYVPGHMTYFRKEYFETVDTRNSLFVTKLLESYHENKDFSKTDRYIKLKKTDLRRNLKLSGALPTYNYLEEDIFKREGALTVASLSEQVTTEMVMDLQQISESDESWHVQILAKEMLQSYEEKGDFSNVRANQNRKADLKRQSMVVPEILKQKGYHPAAVWWARRDTLNRCNPSDPQIYQAMNYILEFEKSDYWVGPCVQDAINKHEYLQNKVKPGLKDGEKLKADLGI